MPTTNVGLINGCCNGDNLAWEQFYQIYGPIIYRFARKAGLKAQDAEEVVQNVMRSFMQAFRGKFSLNHGIGRFRHYLRKAANREIAKQRRKTARCGVSIDDSPAPAAEDKALKGLWKDIEFQERMRACLGRLREMPAVTSKDYRVFVRYALHGNKPAIVARDEGISRGSVYRIKSEMIQRLRWSWNEMQAEMGEL